MIGKFEKVNGRIRTEKVVHANSISFRCLNNHELLNALIKSNSPFHFWLQQEFQFFTAVSLINGTKLKNLPMYIMKPKLLISVDDLVLVYCNLSPILYSGPKGAFFQKSRFFVQISQSPNLPISQKNIPKNYTEFEIWNSRPYQ